MCNSCRNSSHSRREQCSSPNIETTCFNLRHRSQSRNCQQAESSACFSFRSCSKSCNCQHADQGLDISCCSCLSCCSCCSCCLCCPKSRRCHNHSSGQEEAYHSSTQKKSPPKLCQDEKKQHRHRSSHKVVIEQSDKRSSSRISLKTSLLYTSDSNMDTLTHLIDDIRISVRDKESYDTFTDASDNNLDNGNDNNRSTFYFNDENRSTFDASDNNLNNGNEKNRSTFYFNDENRSTFKFKDENRSNTNRNNENRSNTNRNDENRSTINRNDNIRPINVNENNRETLFDIINRNLPTNEVECGRVTITNTCTISSFLLSLWATCKIDPSFFARCLTLANQNMASSDRHELYHSLNFILRAIDNSKWGLAKYNWVYHVMDIKRMERPNFINCTGTTERFYASKLRILQAYDLDKVCSCKAVHPRQLQDSNRTIINTNDVNHPYISSNMRCSQCSELIYKTIVFRHNPLWLVVDLASIGEFVPCGRFKREIQFIDGSHYQLICVIGTDSEGGHFQSILYIDQQFYLFDDLISRAGLQPIGPDFGFETIESFIYFKMFD